MPGVEPIETEEDEVHIQVKLFTQLKDVKYHTPETPFSVPAESACTELDNLVKSLLKSEENEDLENFQFDFLIEGEYLRTSIKEYTASKNLSAESVVKIEYTLRQDSPELSQSLLHNDWVSSVDVHDDMILTGSYDNTVKVWNTAGKCLRTIEGHTMAVRKVVWNTLESFISASQDQTAIVWKYNPEDGSSHAIHVCKGHTRSVDSLAVNPSGDKFASGSWDKMIKIWEAGVDTTAGNEDEADPKRICKKDKDNLKQVRTPLQTYSGHKEPVSGLLWHDDQELLSCSWDHCIRLWDASTATNKHTITGNKVVLSIAYSSTKSLLASGSADKFVRLFDVRASGDVVHKMLTSHEGWVSGVDWSPNNENVLVSGSYDCSVKLWDIRCISEPLESLGKHEDKVMCLLWKDPKYILSGAADCCLNVYEYKV